MQAAFFLAITLVHAIDRAAIEKLKPSLNGRMIGEILQTEQKDDPEKILFRMFDFEDAFYDENSYESSEESYDYESNEEYPENGDLSKSTYEEIMHHNHPGLSESTYEETLQPIFSEILERYKNHVRQAIKNRCHSRPDSRGISLGLSNEMREKLEKCEKNETDKIDWIWLDAYFCGIKEINNYGPKLRDISCPEGPDLSDNMEFEGKALEPVYEYPRKLNLPKFNPKAVICLCRIKKALLGCGKGNMTVVTERAEIVIDEELVEEEDGFYSEHYIKFYYLSEQEVVFELDLQVEEISSDGSVNRFKPKMRISLASGKVFYLWLHHHAEPNDLAVWTCFKGALSYSSEEMDPE